VLTGVHVFHVLIGLVFLVILRRELHTKSRQSLQSRQSRQSRPGVRHLEIGATYWHMVDFIWFVIFALLYLMR